MKFLGRTLPHTAQRWVPKLQEGAPLLPHLVPQLYWMTRISPKRSPLACSMTSRGSSLGWNASRGRNYVPFIFITPEPNTLLDTYEILNKTCEIHGSLVYSVSPALAFSLPPAQLQLELWPSSHRPDQSPASCGCWVNICWISQRRQNLYNLAQQDSDWVSSIRSQGRLACLLSHAALWIFLSPHQWRLFVC